MTLRVGFIGYGFMGQAHANALARLPMFFPEAPETERHVLCGRNEERVAAAADRFGFSHTTDDWETLVHEVDVLYNLGPNDLHAEPTIAALENDVHVLCEKPLAKSLESAERMVEAAGESDAVAACAFNYRYVPALRLAKELIEQGALGQIRHVRGTYLVDWQANPDHPWVWRNNADRAGYGQVGDVGSHTIDLARWLVGEITDVSGRLATLVDERPTSDGEGTRPVTTDDIYLATASFESGAVGVFDGSSVASGHKATNAIEIIGSEGAVRFDLERLNELEVYDADRRGYERIVVTDEDDPYGHRWWPAGHTIGWEHTVVHENYEFLRAIDGESDNIVSFESALTVQRIIDAIVQSDDRGERVALETET
ncbi:Gfo/Idh/MocA family protein [Halostagnicola kamekurae]|uniref:Predicted dehydrogenase n=1 Tax=Halostagnicola kamekurae TaxID=619731 RepID=A0A1I6UJD7_9EURY|nr:Gfo/Idh/MocA family oxidoreductase [Halostagnicola kamekurae]SFT01464.1 Predicted dehydrogenase [Halostagnicola kamekurae]